ncbi:MAG TPA: hypothetical protein VGE69_15735 [Pseudomonadales bacterium]
MDNVVRHGIAQVHVHCHEHNVPSARMIMANGGVLASKGRYNGECIQRYVVEQDSP